MAVNIYGYRLNSALNPLLSEINRIIKDKENAILLVPEHYTLQAEKDLLYRLKLNGLFNIEVMSPKRLQKRIIESNPFIPNNLLELSGEAIAISRIAQEHIEELSYYKDCFNNSGVYTELVKFLHNMYSNEIESEQIDSYISTLENTALKNKWSDINILYRHYLQLENQHFLLNADKSKIIAKSIDKYKLLKGNQILVYGFDALSGDLVSLLTKAANYAKSIKLYVALCDSKARDMKIYSLMRSSLEQLCTNLQDNGIHYEYSYSDEIAAEMPKPFVHLLNELYAKPSKKSNQKYSEDQNNIFIYNAKNPHLEAKFISNKIYDLAIKGIELSRIAIMLPSNSDDEFLLDSALRNRAISFYNAQSYNIINHSIVNFLLSSLRIVSDKSNIDPVINLLNNNLCILDFDERSLLKNYIKEHGIQGNHLYKSFTRGKETYREKAEQLRQKLVEPLIKLRQSLEDASDLSEMILSCIAYIENSNLYNKIINDDNTLKKIGFLQSSEQSEQVINMIELVFEQLSLVSANAKLSLSELANYLEYGFTLSEINTLPPLKNSVIIGSLDHILLNDIDYLFIMDFNDTYLNPAASEIFSDYELNKFAEETNVDIYLSKENKNNLNALHLKKALTLSQKELYISYSSVNILGDELYPNSLISELKNRFFENINIIEDNYIDINSIISEYKRLMLSYEFCPNSEKNTLLEKLAKSRAFLLENGVDEDYLKDILLKKSPAKINKHTAKRLFHTNSISISKLEKYASCPFKYYMEYGIKPNIIEPWEQNARDTGTFYHSIMETVSNRIRNGLDISSTSDTVILDELENIIQSSNALQSESTYTDTKRNSIKYKNEVKKTILFSAKTFIDQMKQSKFKTKNEELRFDKYNNPFSITLDDGTKIFFNGSIDRLDECDDCGNKYLRIVDYKSSAKEFDAAKIYYGVQLQLLIYLSVALNIYSDALPAGAFYFHISLPWIESSNNDPREKLRMNGLVLKDINSIKLLDQDLKNPLNNKKLLNNDDSFSKTIKSFLSEEDFQKLMDHALNKAKFFASQINEGNIEILPLKVNTSLACDYCEYKEICMVDNEENLLKNMDFTELLNMI